MPYEKDVQERKWWLCPKWYWPFAVCSGIRTQHKWCYNFAWVKETRYGFIGKLEGCENGKLYTWTRPVLGVGSDYYPGGEICFDSSLGSDEGRCDPSREGMLASGLFASAPYVSSIHQVVNEIRSDVVETGTFDFSGEYKRLCQEGLWPWSRTSHEQSVVASVTTRFANIQWYVGGVPLTSNSGTIALGAQCTWPFPLPSGRSEMRSVSVRYEIQTATNSSVLILYNAPADGTYSVDISLVAIDHDTGQQYKSLSSSAYFCGETCDFDPAKVAELQRCLKSYLGPNIQQPQPHIGPSSPDPVFVVNNEIGGLVPQAKAELVASILEVMRMTVKTDSEVFTQAAMILANQIGVSDVSRFWSLKLPDSAANSNAPALTGCGCSQNTATAIVALGIGLLAWRLVRGSRAR